MKGPAIATGWLHEDAIAYRAVSISISVKRATKEVRSEEGVNVAVEKEIDEDEDVSNDHPVLMYGRPNDDDDSGMVDDWTA